eukprot:2540501-Amphidinium_carterae.1
MATLVRTWQCTQGPPLAHPATTRSAPRMLPSHGRLAYTISPRRQEAKSIQTKTYRVVQIVPTKRVPFQLQFLGESISGYKKSQLSSALHYSSSGSTATMAQRIAWAKP